MIFAVAVLGSFLLYLVIGIVVGRKVKNKSDYYVAGRSAPTLLVAGTLVASYMSTVAFLGEFGYAFDGFAVPMLLLIVLNIAGYVVGVLGFGRYLRRAEVLTVPEFFGRRVDSQAVRSIAGVMVVLGIGLYLVAVTQGLSLVISELLGWPTWVTVIVVWVAYSVFTLLSGSKGVLINDTIMFLIFTVVGILGMAWVFARAGGPQEAMAKMTALVDKPDGLSWTGASGLDSSFGSGAEVLIWALTLGVVWMAVVAVSPWQSSRYLMAKNEHVATRSGFIAMTTVGVLYAFLMFGAFAINLFAPDIDRSELAFIWAAQNLMPPVLGVLAVTGVVAAALSSASTFLSLIGFSAANDIFAARSQDGENEAAALKKSRIVMLCAGVAVLLATLWAPAGVLTIGYFAATLFAAAWGPLAVWSIRGRKLTAAGAASGMIAGFVGVGILNGMQDFGGITLPVWANPVVIGFALSIMATLIGNRVGQHSAAADAFLRKIHKIPAEDVSTARVRTTRRVALASATTFVVLLGLFIAYYVVPMSDAVSAAP
ncbi:sodium:solute symporter family protein [Zhihengliuella salsuginis]|uniref:Sodium:proline symporter n=1 Tax=Zhihengliuella salsuginis TaxID=578222 RepID=A0ABQ3GJD8_9MICC|nr:sodium:solute symporter family protein [Zhihengliuella salsuginis]GHD06878.1 sodium:proline symporter [Zhihengliuella salsuginis]